MIPLYAAEPEDGVDDGDDGDDDGDDDGAGELGAEPVDAGLAADEPDEPPPFAPPRESVR